MLLITLDYNYMGLLSTHKKTFWVDVKHCCINIILLFSSFTFLYKCKKNVYGKKYKHGKLIDLIIY